VLLHAVLPIAFSARLLCLCGLVSGLLLLSLSLSSHLPICARGIPKPGSSQVWPCSQPPLPAAWLVPGVSWGQVPGSVFCSPPWATGPSQMPAWTAQLPCAPGDAEESILHWDPLPPPKSKAWGSSPLTTRSFAFDECSSLLWSLWSCTSPTHLALGLWLTHLDLLPASGFADRHRRHRV